MSKKTKKNIIMISMIIIMSIIILITFHFAKKNIQYNYNNKSLNDYYMYDKGDNIIDDSSSSDKKKKDNNTIEEKVDSGVEAKPASMRSGHAVAMPLANKKSTIKKSKALSPDYTNPESNQKYDKRNNTTKKSASDDGEYSKKGDSGNVQYYNENNSINSEYNKKSTEGDNQYNEKDTVIDNDNQLFINSDDNELSNFGLLKNNKVSLKYIIMFIIENIILSLLIIYLLLSKFNEKEFKEVFNNKKNIIIYIVITIVLSSLLTIGIISFL